MLEMRSFYDASSKTLRIEYKNNLIKKYKKILLENIEKADFDKGVSVDSPSENKIVLSIPMDIDQQTIVNGIGKLDEQTAEKINTIFNDFVTVSLNAEVRTTEIIPLDGYPLDNLKEEIKEAIKAKRNFCIIDTYKNYLKFNSRETVSLNQVKFKYLSNEYCDFAIDLENCSDIKELQEKYSHLLKKTDWI